MKKLIALLLAACMILGLCACGETEVETPETEPQVQGTEPQSTEPATEDAPSEQPTEDDTKPQPSENLEASDFELAQTCIDLPVEELYALIGEPESCDYAPSCLNPEEGEDGNLYYDGFIVYTYREGDTETVTYVEEAQ